MAVNVVFKPLYSCLHRCGFCHLLHVPRTGTYLSTQTVKRHFDEIIEKWGDQGVCLSVSGGEFALRRDAAELLRYFWTQGRDSLRWVSLDTMGVPFAKESLARELSEWLSEVNVSVHSANEDQHRLLSRSQTRLADVVSGLENLVKHVSAVRVNTAITRINYRWLTEIAGLVLQARHVRPNSLLSCHFYFPGIRTYGPPTNENRHRLPGIDNTKMLPEVISLPQIADEFLKARTLLSENQVSASLTDFNLPACIYHRVTGEFPNSSYGLPSNVDDTIVIDFAHSVTSESQLEDVYPSRQKRIWEECCTTCAARLTCSGVSESWKECRAIRPVDEQEFIRCYRAHVFNQALAETADGPLRNETLAELRINWNGLHSDFVRRLEGEVTSDMSIGRIFPSTSRQQRIEAITMSILNAFDPETRALWNLLRPGTPVSQALFIGLQSSIESETTKGSQPLPIALPPSAAVPRDQGYPGKVR